MTESEDILHCPSCGGRDVRHSPSHGIMDSLMAKLGKEPFRCRGCRHRFYKRALPKTTGHPPDDADHSKDSNAG